MNATVEPFSLRLDPPLTTAREQLSERRGLLLRVHGNQMAYGEATPLPPFTESYEAAENALDHATASFTEDGWFGAFRAVSKTDDRRLRYPAARHAVSLAYFDWRAKQEGLSLAEYLGGNPPETVLVNATVGDGGPTETAEKANQAQEQGYPAVKVKVGNRSVEADLKRLGAVRERVGERFELRADANGAWNLETAVSFFEGADELGLSAVEQPLPADKAKEHAKLRRFDADVALDESLAVGSPQQLIEAGVADRYVLKPMAVGGIDVARGLTGRVRRAGATAVITSIFESVVGRTAAVHLAASIGGLPACGLGTADRFVEDLGPDPAPVRAGAIDPPPGPGLGIGEVRIDG